jgi:uncharacterized phosphosugar-binding protein
MSINLTDAERAFGDSPAGCEAIALAKASHSMAQAHRGEHGRAWTLADEAAVVRDAATRSARARLGMVARDTASAPLSVIEQIALVRGSDHNAWRKG